MDKFRKVERIVSFIPYASLLFITVSTFVILSIRKAKWHDWLKFFLAVAGAMLAIMLGKEFLLIGNYWYTEALLVSAIGIIFNLLLIRIQTASEGKAPSGSSEDVEASEQVSEQEPKKPAKRKGGRIGVIVAVVVMAILFTIAASFATVRIVTAIVSNANGQIEDANGDEDISLCVVTDADIMNPDTQYVAFGVSGATTGATSGVTGDARLEKVDGDAVSLKYGKMSGVRTVHATLSSTDLLKLTVSSEVAKGNCRIVIVVDGVYYCDVEPNTTEEISVTGANGKLVLVKLAGESLKIDMDVLRQ